MSDIGELPMPEDFRYRDILSRGKPQHTKTDAFRLRHPSMVIGKRAKIFAPFDALRGFSDAVASKRELYEARREQSEEILEELDRRLGILYELTRGRPPAQRRFPEIAVTVFVPCTDENNEAFGTGGQYCTLTGICRNVDLFQSRCLLLDSRQIRISDIYQLESPAGLFDRDGLT